MPNPYESRTTQKLEFAELYLQERLKCANTGDTQERAHEETFLYHLIGAKDSFLQEINHALDLGVPEDRVNEKNLRIVLDRSGRRCLALDEIESLENTESSWLNLARWFRHQGTHRANIGRFVYASTVRSRADVFKNPHSGQPMGQDIPEFLSHCFDQMVELILRLRASLP